MRRAAVLIAALAIPSRAAADPAPEPPRRLFVAAGLGAGILTGDDNEGASNAASLTMQLGVPVRPRLHVLLGLDTLTLARYEPDPTRYQENLVVFTGVRWTSRGSRDDVDATWYARATIGPGHITRRDYTPFAEDSDSGPWGLALGAGLGYRLRNKFFDTGAEIVDQIILYDGGVRHAIGINFVFEPMSITL